MIRESTHAQKEIDEDAIPQNDPGISRHDKGPTSQEVALLERRQLAMTASDAIAEIYEVDVTPSMLFAIAQDPEKSPARLKAVRALRAIEAVGREDSAVVELVGEQGVYHFVEGVINYGASEKYWLALCETYGLDAEATTSLYDLREQIAAYTNGQKPGFRAIHNALATLGITIPAAVVDPEATVLIMYEAGFFMNYAGNRLFDHPVFSPKMAGAEDAIIDDDPDGSIGRGILDAINGSGLDEYADTKRLMKEVYDN